MNRANDHDPYGYKAKIDALGTTQIAAAEAIGWTAKKMHRFVNGDHKSRSYADIQKFEGWLAAIAKQQGVDISTPGALRERGSADVVPLNARRHLPVYGLVGASNGGLHLNHDAVVGTVEAPPGLDPRGDCFLVEVFGPSMEPRYFSGERAVAARNKPPRPGQDVIVELKNGDAYLKVYLSTRQGVVWCDQWNKEEVEDDTPLHWPLSEVKALHAVVSRA